MAGLQSFLDEGTKVIEDFLMIVLLLRAPLHCLSLWEILDYLIASQHFDRNVF